jgi:Protein of unknown function (DUF2934)
MHPEHRSIGELAYHLWQARGCPEGSAEQDWLDAERQLRSAPPAAELRSAEARAAEPTVSTDPRSEEPAVNADSQWKAPRAPRAPSTGSAARPRRSKSTQGKPSPEAPG